MSERTRTVEEILDILLDLPVPRRQQRIVELCGADEDLRAEVQSLLDAYERSGDFLETSVPAAVEPVSDRRRDRIGPYEILERVGSGGMGDVYLARRTGESYEQRVAIKLVRGTALAAEGLRRFHNECRVLAKLDHPNIARMIEGAIAEDGTPYLVMEFVEGRPIDRYCDEEGLDVGARVALVREVCAAVQHLHQHSSIHRDIKPANVLVKPDGHVKLIDFGIARVLDLAEEVAGEMTVAGFERMTPAYASPEQLRGEDLSTATDVYSAGVLLYRVLTGSLPFSGSSRRELEREVTQTGAMRPSEAARLRSDRLVVARQLEGDLDTIVLMAMHRDPERRYSSAEQFGEDLDRYLQGRPVLARGDSWRYRTGKFLRRNPVAVLTSVGFLLTLVAATITGFVLFAGAERARTEAVTERETALAVSNFLVTLLQAADPGVREAGEDLTVRTVLDRASDRIEMELQEQPRLAMELRLTLGRAYHNLGALDHSLDQYAAIRAQPTIDDPDLLARVRLQEAETRLLLEESATAESLLTTVLADSTRLRPETLATAHLTRAQLHNQNGRYEEAMASARASHALRAGMPPRSLIPAQATSIVGEIAYRTGDLDTAERFMAEASEIARATLGERHTLTATCLQNLAIVLAGRGRHAAAIETFERALPVMVEIYGEQHIETANTRVNLADVLRTVGREREALELYARARAVISERLGRDSYRTATVVANESTLLHRLGEIDRAEEGLREAIRAYGVAFGEGHPWMAIVQINLARLWIERGRIDEAEVLAADAESVLARTLPGDNHHIARVLGVGVEIDLERGRIDAAREKLERADPIIRRLPVQHGDRVIHVILRARYRSAIGEADSALASLRNHQERIAALVAPEGLEMGMLERALRGLEGERSSGDGSGPR